MTVIQAIVQARRGATAALGCAAVAPGYAGGPLPMADELSMADELFMSPPRLGPISLLRLSLLRFLDSRFPGNSLWT